MLHKFTEQAKAKGWTNTAVAERWGLKPRQLSNIAANPSQKYQDALNGLPDLKNGAIMETIIESSGYKVQFNGGSTYFLMDITGKSYGSFSTELKAINAFKRTLRRAGYECEE